MLFNEALYKDIVNELGEKHIEYGAIIVYTSNGSNLCIAAHEDVIPASKLFEYAEKIRELSLTQELKIGRIIAQEFTGKPGNFKLTNERREIAVKPPTKSILNLLEENNLDVISIGKTTDIFNGRKRKSTRRNSWIETRNS